MPTLALGIFMILFWTAMLLARKYSTRNIPSPRLALYIALPLLWFAFGVIMNQLHPWAGTWLVVGIHCLGVPVALVVLALGFLDEGSPK